MTTIKCTIIRNCDTIIEITTADEYRDVNGTNFKAIEFAIDRFELMKKAMIRNGFELVKTETIMKNYEKAIFEKTVRSEFIKSIL